MAPRKRKKTVKKIKFQLTRSGIAGVAVVCFCIFLWMFLIGVWAGQNLLYPPVQKTKKNVELESITKKQTFDVTRLEAKKKKKIVGH